MATTEPQNPSKSALEKRPKSELVLLIIEQQAIFHSQINEREKIISELTEQLGKLNQEQEDQKKKALNLKVNQPSSKKPEWDKEGNPRLSKFPFLRGILPSRFMESKWIEK